MAEDYKEKHEEKVTGGFIGWQLGYLNALKECYDNLRNHSSALLKTQGDLFKACETVLKTRSKVELENKEVYKAQVPPKKDLILPEPANKLKSLERPNCKTLLPELKKSFKNKKSRNFNRIIADLEVVISTNKNNLFVLIKRVSKKKMFVYQDNKIDTLLSSVSQSSTKKVLDNLNSITKEYGGYMGYLQLSDNLQKLFSKNDEKAKNIMRKIQQDRDQDHAFQRSTGMRIPSLKESNPEVVQQFEKHGIALTQCKKKDKEVLADFEKYSEVLRRAEDNEFQKSLHELSQGLGKVEGADQLAKIDGVVTGWFDGRILPKKQEILDYYKSLDLQEMVVNIFMNRFSEEQTYLDLNGKLEQKTADINENIEKQHSLLNKMSETATKVNTQIQSHKALLEKKQALVSDINGAHLLYQMLLNNIELHSNIERALDLIEQSLNDYFVSKEMQKKELMAESKGPGGNVGGGYHGGNQNMGQGQGQGQNNKGISGFLSDILKDQGFEFKF